jgi:tetratricopeptide (TPR) repeat protein
MSMREEGEAQVRLADRIAGIVEAVRVPLLVVLVVVVAGVIAYFIYAQASAASLERNAMLLEQADEQLASWQAEQDAQKKAQVETELRAKLETLRRSGGYPGQRGLHLLGQLAAEKGDKQAAFDAFNALAASAGRSYLGLEGLINAAVYAEDLARTDEALTLYRRIIDEHASSVHAPHAYFSVGRMQEAKGDFKAAVETYTELRSRHPTGSWTNLAVNRIIFLQASGKVAKD